MSQLDLMESLPFGLRAAVEWYRERGELPRTSKSAGVSAEELAAGRCLSKERYVRRHAAAMDALVPGWDSVRRGRRTNRPPGRLLEVRDFVDANGRFPGRRRGGAEERRLGEALHAARVGVYPHHEDWLDAELPGWRGGTAA